MAGNTTLHELSFESLADLDNGKIPASFNMHLERVLADLNARAFDESSRTITVTVNVIPEMEEDGVLAGVKLQAHVKSKIPQHKSRVYQMDVRKRKGKTQAMFSEITADGSPSIFDGEQEEKE